MISQNDLYDISFALVTIRNDIKNTLNNVILSKIIQVLACDEREFEDNQVRKALASIPGLDQARWRYVYHNNVHVNHRFLKNRYIYGLLIKLCEQTICVLNAQAFENAYDFMDSYHCLPDIIADNNFRIPRSYWKIYIRLYREKWENKFLNEEQKDIKRYS